MKKRWIALMTVWAMLAYVLAGCGGIVIPAVWFDASNMDDPDVARILYD